MLNIFYKYINIYKYKIYIKNPKGCVHLTVKELV